MEVEGIIIRQTPFQDSDMMITLLSKERLYSFLARGVLKLDSKNASAVDLFNYGQYSLMSGKKGKTLRNAQVLNTFPNIRKDLSGLASFDFISELNGKMVDNDNVAEVYPYLLKILELMNDGFDRLTLLLIYFAAILRISGYGLDVDECVICHQKSQISAINYREGGFICLNCLNTLNQAKMHSRKLKIIRYIFKVKAEDIGSVSFDREESLELINELSEFAKEVSDLYLKSLKLIKTL